MIDPKPQSAIDLDQLRELAKAAQQGPWCVDYESEVSDPAPYICGPKRGYTVVSVDGVMEDNDAYYIAAASPFVILALLHELEELRGIRLRIHELADPFAGGGSQTMDEIERLTR